MEEIIKLDEERKNQLYLAGELQDLSRWLENYKDGGAREEAIRLIDERIKYLRDDAQTLLDLIIYKKSHPPLREDR